MQVLLISLLEAPVFLAFSAAIHSFIIFFFSAGVLPPDLSALVTCRWCGEDADAGLVPSVVGDSAA